MSRSRIPASSDPGLNAACGPWTTVLHSEAPFNKKAALSKPAVLSLATRLDGSNCAGSAQSPESVFHIGDGVSFFDVKEWSGPFFDAHQLGIM